MLDKKLVAIALTVSTLSVLAGGLTITYASEQTTGNQMMTSSSANETSNSNGLMTMDNNQNGGDETMTSRSMKDHSHAVSVVRDSEAILLEGKSLPAGDFIHLYDSTPYMIVDGHVAAKVPCDSNSDPEVQVLIGSTPELAPADLELVPELSHPGDLCLYHVDLVSDPSPANGENATIITDIALSNPGNDDIEFPATSTVVIGVNEIMPIEGGHEHGGDHEEH